MLADVGDDDGFAFGGLPDVVDDMRRAQLAIVWQFLDATDRGTARQVADPRDPRVVPLGLHLREPFQQHRPQVALHGDIGAHVLVQLRRIDVDVDFLRVLGVRGQLAGDAVVEAHAEREQQVRFLDGVVHPRLAVHPHHAEVQRMLCGHAADAEQRHGNGNVRAFGERQHFRHGTALEDAVAGEDHRALGGRQ